MWNGDGVLWALRSELLPAPRRLREGRKEREEGETERKERLLLPLPSLHCGMNSDSLHSFSHYLLSTSSVLQASRLTSYSVIRLSLSELYTV